MKHECAAKAPSRAHSVDLGISLGLGLCGPLFPPRFYAREELQSISGFRRPSETNTSEVFKELVETDVECLGNLFQRPDADFLVPVLQL